MRYKRLPMGPSVSPPLFVQFMQQVIGSLPAELRGRTTVYFDDVMVGGETEEDLRRDWDTIHRIFSTVTFVGVHQGSGRCLTLTSIMDTLLDLKGIWKVMCNWRWFRLVESFPTAQQKTRGDELVLHVDASLAGWGLAELDGTRIISLGKKW
eukprot:Filipodium_phascolosomae@DN5885_c0_g1_i1.p1